MNREFGGCIYFTKIGTCLADQALKYINTNGSSSTINHGVATRVNLKLAVLGKDLPQPSLESYELMKTYQQKIADRAREVSEMPKPIMRGLLCGQKNACPWREN